MENKSSKVQKFHQIVITDGQKVRLKQLEKEQKKLYEKQTQIYKELKEILTK